MKELVLMHTGKDGDRAYAYQAGPGARYTAHIHLSNTSTNHWFATVRFLSTEKDFSAKSREDVLRAATNWVDASPELSHFNRAGKTKRPLSRAKANVAARRRRKARRYALPLAGTKLGGVGTATFQSRRQATKYAEEIGANPKSIKKNY